VLLYVPITVDRHFYGTVDPECTVKIGIVQVHLLSVQHTNFDSSFSVITFSLLQYAFEGLVAVRFVEVYCSAKHNDTVASHYLVRCYHLTIVLPSYNNIILLSYISSDV
jgi:hypothetical protein